MKVLFLSQRVPWPPDRGDRITTSHFLGHFLARGATVRVGCLAEDEVDEAAARTLGEKVAAVCAPRIDRRRRKLTSLRGLLTGEALTLPFFRSRPLMRTVRKWLAEDPADLVWVYSSSMAQYALAGTGALRVMQFAELDSDKWLQFAARSRGIAKGIYAREARLLLDFERRVARTFDVSFVVSDVERDLFRQRIPDVDPLVLPNGVDVDHFRSRGDAARNDHTIVFTGVMDYEPNVDGVLWFAAECWPAIRRRVPDARFLVVGSKPIQRILDLAQQPGIEVTGRVPETPPYFDRAAVAIAPLRLARGVQNKVLEAMSMGLPVVSTRAAAQGLGDGAADALVIAEGSDATIAAVCRLLEDPPAARALGDRAARFVRARFRWEEMYRRCDAVIDAKLAARKDGRP